jgi:hypothetical protein
MPSENSIWQKHPIYFQLSAAIYIALAPHHNHQSDLKAPFYDPFL